MRLPESDEAYLNEKAHVWELMSDGSGGAALVIRDFRLFPGKYDRSSINLMIRIPAGYNNAALDMYYVDPPIRLVSTGAYPQAAESFEQHAGRQWQRFSRHLQQPWRPGIDGLPMFLALIQRELQSA
jgi:hypothetical protein